MVIELLSKICQVPFTVSLSCWVQQRNGVILYLAAWNYYPILNLNFVSLFLSPRYGYNHKLLLTKLADQFFQLALQYLADGMAVRITILFGIQNFPKKSLKSCLPSKGLTKDAPFYIHGRTSTIITWWFTTLLFSLANGPNALFYRFYD